MTLSFELTAEHVALKLLELQEVPYKKPWKAYNYCKRLFG